jgi:predicted nucleic acid-binding Zn ribbon protein
MGTEDPFGEQETLLPAAQMTESVVPRKFQDTAGSQDKSLISRKKSQETDLSGALKDGADGQIPIDPAEVALARVRARPRETPKTRSRRPKYAGPSTRIRFSGSGPDLRDPQTLNSALGSWARESGVEANLTVAGLTSRWAEIVGDLVASHVSADTYEQFPDGGGRLTITADSPGWESTMNYQTETIKRRIREELGADLVTEIVVRTPGRKKHGRWRVQSGRRR